LGHGKDEEDKKGKKGKERKVRKERWGIQCKKYRLLSIFSY